MRKARFYFSHPVIDKKSENIHSVYNYLNSVSFVKPFESESLFINPNNNRLSKGLDNPSRFANSDDKTLLLFTSGQAMGPSLQSYADLTTILIGDPTLKLNNLRRARDFNATLGQKIASLQSTATSMLDTERLCLFADQDGFISIFQ